jgi:hypothetical protein
MSVIISNFSKNLSFNKGDGPAVIRISPIE